MRPKPKSRRKVSENVQLTERRERVRVLYFINRLSITELEKVLKNEGFKHCDYRTIQRDIDLFASDFIKNLKAKNPNDLIAKVVQQNDEVIKKAWTRYAQASTDQARIHALNLIHNVEKDNIGIFQELGIIEKVADQVRMDQEIVVKFKDPFKKPEDKK